MKHAETTVSADNKKARKLQPNLFQDGFQQLVYKQVDEQKVNHFSELNDLQQQVAQQRLQLDQKQAQNDKLAQEVQKLQQKVKGLKEQLDQSEEKCRNKDLQIEQLEKVNQVQQTIPEFDEFDLNM